ncbi:endonuclease [Alphaproteobacteria bacterium]|nr:endonuclease [Alphaproteobacteria bacterium]
MNKFFYFLLLFFIFFQTSFAQANEGNKKIESFSKSKTFLNKIHQESPVSFYCQCKYNDNKPNWESCGFRPRKDKKRASRIEWEHILPASHFGIKFNAWVNGHPVCISSKGKKFKGRKCTEKVHKLYRYMQADLYNLQPAIGEVNGMRSNYQIGEIEGEEREFGKCDIEIKNKKVEPTPKIRGDIARTYLYMEQTYPQYIKFNQSIKKLIIKWDQEDPVDAWECKRAILISNIQGNTNKILQNRCSNQIKIGAIKPNNQTIDQNDKIDKGKASNLYKLSSENTKGTFKGKGTSNSFK